MRSSMIAQDGIDARGSASLHIWRDALSLVRRSRTSQQAVFDQIECIMCLDGGNDSLREVRVDIEVPRQEVRYIAHLVEPAYIMRYQVFIAAQGIGVKAGATDSVDRCDQNAHLLDMVLQFQHTSPGQVTFLYRNRPGAWHRMWVCCL